MGLAQIMVVAVLIIFFFVNEFGFDVAAFKSVMLSRSN